MIIDYELDSKFTKTQISKCDIDFVVKHNLVHEIEHIIFKIDEIFEHEIQLEMFRETTLEFIRELILETQLANNDLI